MLCLIFFGIGLDFVKKKTNRNSIINYEEIEDRLFNKADINKATFSELRTIPGLGEDLAQRIVDYRKQYGGFENVEELKNVRGIKEKKLEQVKKYITITNKKY